MLLNAKSYCYNMTNNSFTGKVEVINNKIVWRDNSLVKKLVHKVFTTSSSYFINNTITFTQLKSPINIIFPMKLLFSNIVISRRLNSPINTTFSSKIPRQ